MSVPAELKYTAEHEWVSIEDEKATIGITDFAAQALGDVVYVSLPTVGTTVAAGDACGEVESYKSVNELYSPVSGEVTEVNEELNDDPALINAEPYALGWIFKVRLAAAEQDPAGLLSAAEYEALTAAAN
jgi:glycine cleavage system H protein